MKGLSDLLFKLSLGAQCAEHWDYFKFLHLVTLLTRHSYKHDVISSVYVYMQLNANC